MNEEAQGSIEYLLMLAAVLVILASVILLIRTTSADLGNTVGQSISSVRENVINILTSG